MRDSLQNSGTVPEPLQIKPEGEEIVMDLLQKFKELYHKWDFKGGKSGRDDYEDALYDCINDLGDIITECEKEQKWAASHICKGEEAIDVLKDWLTCADNPEEWMRCRDRAKKIVACQSTREG